MNRPLTRVLLSVAGFGIFAFAVGFLFSAELWWELWAAGVAGLLAYNVGYPALALSRNGFALRRRDQARAFHGPLPEGLPQSYGLTILDREYRVSWCNDAAAAHLGIDGWNDVGRPLAALVRHPSLSDYLAAGNFSKSLRMQAAGAGAPILALQFVPYADSQWLLVSRNVARAARLEVMRRECIANVSHELRAPLTVLVGLLEIMRERNLDARLSHDYLDRMEAQCKRLQRIIEGLLRLSELESAPEPSSNERVNVGSILDRVRAEAEALSAGRHRIVLEAEAGLDLLGAECEIASAFSNLASNAVRYTAPGGLVRLVWRALPAGAEFAVDDTGIGIDKEHIPRLTERFYRVDRERSRHCGGTGLGLAIVKQALLRHQGTLEIESEPGRGSRFIARFPAHRVVAAAAQR